MNKNSKNKKNSTKALVLASLLTALVIILQMMGAFIKFGVFSVSLVLVPIVIGAALCGPKVAAWLGFVFGGAVLLNGDASAFLTVNPIGTVLTVLSKGILCGLISGFAYKVGARRSTTAGVFTAAVVCPIVNTGVFLLGCLGFFMPTIATWASELGFGDNVARYMIFGLVGGNFLFELLFNIILSPIVVRLLNAKQG